MSWLIYIGLAIGGALFVLGALYRVIDVKHFPSMIRPVAANAWKIMAFVGGLVVGLWWNQDDEVEAEIDTEKPVDSNTTDVVDYEKPDLESDTVDTSDSLDDYFADPAGDGPEQ